jgi:site-specific recombinase XerC
MARHARGWTLRRRAPGGVYLVRFSHGGLVERSTGTRDRGEAETEAARVYAHHVARESPRRGRVRVGALEEVIAQWLVSLESTHDPGTVATWELYARAHWLPRWLGLHELTRETVEAYRDARLKSVTAATVRKELSALRVFLRWAQVSVPVPSIGKRTTGTPYEKRRRGTAPQLSPKQVAALLAELPEWSTSRKVGRFPIRARFVVAYETSLRPSTLDRLEAPTHYRRGSSTLLITPEIDKARFARELPLTPRARAALDKVCPPEGPIFGSHDYREHVASAAKATLPADVAARFCAAHLRSARITHSLEATGNLPGAQYMAGHKLLASTSVYAKPSLRAAVDMLQALGMPKNPVPARRRKKG